MRACVRVCACARVRVCVRGASAEPRPSLEREAEVRERRDLVKLGRSDKEAREQRERSRLQHDLGSSRRISAHLGRAQPPAARSRRPRRAGGGGTAAAAPLEGRAAAGRGTSRGRTREAAAERRRPRRVAETADVVRLTQSPTWPSRLAAADTKRRRRSSGAEVLSRQHFTSGCRSSESERRSAKANRAQSPSRMASRARPGQCSWSWKWLKSSSYLRPAACSSSCAPPMPLSSQTEGDCSPRSSRA